MCSCNDVSPCGPHYAELMAPKKLDAGEIGTTITPAYETKDTGDRVEYDSGMVRDTNGGKPRFDLMIPKGVPFEDLYLTRVAHLYRRGAVKYTERNWEKANSQEELDRALESAFRHFMQWYAGETDEDHAAAVFFNINEAETIRVKLRPEVARKCVPWDEAQDVMPC